MSLDPRSPAGFERLETAAAHALERAKSAAADVRTASENAVVRWEHATGEWHSAHPLGSEYVARAGAGTPTNDAASASHDFGFDAERRLRVMVAHPPGAPGVRSAYTHFEDGLEVTTYLDEDQARKHARASGVMVCWRDPSSPTFLVVRRGDALYREVIDLREPGRAHVYAASSAWRSFGLQVNYEVELDAGGRARRVATSQGAVLYERPRRALAAVLRELSRDLSSELERALARSKRSTTTAVLVLSHGTGAEVFPPMLHIAPGQPGTPTDLHELLEDPSTEEIPLYAEKAPPWVDDVVGWLGDDVAQTKVVDTMKATVAKVNRDRTSVFRGRLTLLARA